MMIFSYRMPSLATNTEANVGIFFRLLGHCWVGLLQGLATNVRPFHMLAKLLVLL